MKNKNSWMGWLLGLVLIATYILPTGTILTFADEGPTAFISIGEVSQTSVQIQPGDIFTIEADVTVSGVNTGTDNEKIYISNATASGSGIDASNASFTVEGDPEITGKNGVKTVKVTGLVYNGDSKEIQMTVQTGTSYQSSESIGSGTKSYTLDAKTSDDLKDTLTVEKQDNLLVKPGQTQNVQVKVSNKGNFTINQATLTLALGEKVEGLEIKTDSGKLSSIKAKEVKTATFSIKVGEDVKAGVYKANVTVNGNSFPINIQVDSNVVPSVLEVITNGNKVFTPGVGQQVTFTLKNVGDRDAKNIRAEVVNTENISIIGGSNVSYIAAIASKATNDITMTLKMGANVKADSVPVQIKLSYLNSLGEEKEDTQYVYLSTSASTVASEVVISNVISPTKTYVVDKNFTIKFNVSSKSGAENLKVSVKGDEGIVPKSQNLFFLNKLGVGEKKEYSVTFAATRTAVSSTHPIEISIEYGTGETPTVVNQYGSVNISNPEKDAEGDNEEGIKKGTPKVIIGKYKINPVVVKAGEEFDLEIGFLNTHKNEAVHNLKANLKIVEQGENNTGNVFTPVGASNTFYIADLNAGETITKKIRMYTIPSASPKTYQVSLEMEYENEKGVEVTASENIGIPVEQVTKVEVGEVTVDYGQVGMETSFNATIYNMGKTDVSNMVVHIEGKGFNVQDNKLFIGAFEKGQTQDYAPIIIPDQTGILTGTIIIEYEDTTGQQQQITQEFNIEVQEAMPMEELPMEDPGMMEPEPTNSKLPLILGIGTGVVIAVIVTLVVLKKRKAKNEEMMLDEDE